MQTSKLDLYKTEWLDLVFEKRNKAYGAYELRQHYGDTMSKAMGGTLLSLAVFIAIGYAFYKPQPDGPYVKLTTFQALKSLMIEQPKVEPVKPRTLPPAKPISTTRFVVPVVTAQPITAEPPKVSDLEKTAIGATDVKAAGKGESIELPVNEGEGTGTTIAPPSNVPVDAGSGSLDVMPEPFGGAGAWAKFLQRNIRYPSAASETGATGKVWLTFIIERDGKISNIEVVRPAGFGFDEEATRVLKLAPAWNPGKQNGQAVRVKYTIPINFQLSDN